MQASPKGKNGDTVKCHTAFGVDNCIITAVVRAEKEIGKGNQTMEVNRLQVYDMEESDGGDDIRKHSLPWRSEGKVTNDVWPCKLIHTSGV